MHVHASVQVKCGRWKDRRGDARGDVFPFRAAMHDLSSHLRRYNACKSVVKDGTTTFEHDSFSLLLSLKKQKWSVTVFKLCNKGEAGIRREQHLKNSFCH